MNNNASSQRRMSLSTPCVGARRRSIRKTKRQWDATWPYKMRVSAALFNASSHPWECACITDTRISSMVVFSFRLHTHIGYWARFRIGLSKASVEKNLSEDIFFGFDNMRRGGQSTFVDYIHIGSYVCLLYLSPLLVSST